jgi:hypothetical protein
MTSNPPPNADVPVYVGPLTQGSSERNVQVQRSDGILTHHRPCSSKEQFEAFVEEERPGTDISHDAGRVHWVGDEDVWPREH